MKFPARLLVNDRSAGGTDAVPSLFVREKRTAPAAAGRLQSSLHSPSRSIYEIAFITVRGCAIVFTVAICLASCNHQSPTLDQLIERHAQAVGGKAAIEAIHSIRVELHIVDPGFEVDGSYLAARPAWLGL